MTVLPVDAYLPVLRLALNDHSQALLVAEPGAGKTTRVPLALLDEPWCREGKLLVLEPRRVAARLAAGYMAELLGESVGDTVGYRVRGESRVGLHTRIEVITQGILLRLLQDDPLLEGVAGLVFDEFHERRLDADLSLALALDSQNGLREDLRLLVMSATLDVAALRQVLKSSAPLIECPGRSFPVTTYYRPLVGCVDQARQRANLIREVLATYPGDALVFLPGIADIRRLYRELAGSEDYRILELHGRLPLAQQQAALCREPQGNRRIVLATSIAESSVTVDGVHIVIDAGVERVPVFQPRLAKIAGCSLQVASLQLLGKLLALAYPERVGLSLAPGRFKLAAGGHAWIKESHGLAHAKALVAVELDGNPQGARIYRAASLDPASLSELFPEARSFQTRLEWSETQGRLIGEEVRALGELILESRPLSVLPPQAVFSALLDAVRRRGTLNFNSAARQLLGRVALLKREAAMESNDWPDWSLETLLETLEDWLAPRLDDIRRLDQLDGLPFERILLESLDWHQRQRLDEWAPTHIQVPSGSRIRLDYTQDPPLLAVKLQEVFGLTQTPSVAQGKVPVIMHLLSPAGRPLQVTQDLSNFWRNGYFDVRKDMRGRYSKHPWPEDPSTAVPTARTKRRQTG